MTSEKGFVLIEKTGFALVPFPVLQRAVALNNDYNAEIAKKITMSEISLKQIVLYCENYTEVPSFDRSFCFLSVFLNQNLAKLIITIFFSQNVYGHNRNSEPAIKSTSRQRSFSTGNIIIDFFQKSNLSSRCLLRLLNFLLNKGIIHSKRNLNIFSAKSVLIKRPAAILEFQLVKDAKDSFAEIFKKAQNLSVSIIISKFHQTFQHF